MAKYFFFFFWEAGQEESLNLAGFSEFLIYDMTVWILNPRNACVDVVTSIQDSQLGKLRYQPVLNTDELLLTSSWSDFADFGLQQLPYFRTPRKDIEPAVALQREGYAVGLPC